MHAAHHQSPFRIIYGFEPILSLDLAIQKLSPTNVQAITDLISQHLSCFDVVKLALAKSNEQMAIQANKHCHDIQLNLSDLVSVLTEQFPLARQLSRKLASCWVGPFPFGAIINSVAFCIELPAEYGCAHPVFHINYLRPYVAPVPLSPPAALPLDSIATGEYEVDDILDSRLGYSSTEYLIKWVGYPIFEATQESDAHLANASDIFNQFLSHRG